MLNLADLKVRGWGLIVIALAAQLLVALWLVPDPRVPVTFGGALLLGSYAALLLVAWQNRMLAGMWLVGIGIMLNMLAAVPYGGWVPTTPEALDELFRVLCPVRASARSFSQRTLSFPRIKFPYGQSLTGSRFLAGGPCPVSSVPVTS